ncbi:helix-turn-helix domain-containing protein [soil metagenome]|jgi:AraC-like DNA-binding protein
MLYQKYSPSDALKPFVECYYIWEGLQPLHQPLEVRSLPKGLAALVCNYGDPYQVVNDFHQGSYVPQTFLTGLAKRPYSLRLAGSIGMVGVVFFPTATAHLFGIPAAYLSEERLDLNLIIGSQADKLREEIFEAESHSGKIAVIENFLLGQLFPRKQKTDLVDRAVHLILQHKGLLSMDVLADALYIGGRQFRRKFTEQVGVSPKFYSRLKRFSFVSQMVLGSPAADWQTLVHRGGYYDQAHLIKDFTEFSGKVPSAFVHPHEDLLPHLRKRA